jgi:DNA-directed RNA polymerase subunit RPC12/RpoP
MSSEGTVLGTPAVNLAETKVADAVIHCDECNSDEVYRIFRRGFFQERIYPFFGFFPWRCKRCGLRLMLRDRGLASRMSRTEFKPAETQEQKKFQAA